MIEFILKYFKGIVAIVGLMAGLVTGYLLPTSAWFLAFVIDVKQLEATVLNYEPRVKRVEEFVIRADERYANIEKSNERIERYIREEREFRDRQERMAHKQ